MTRTVNEGFETFHTWLTPTKTETDAAKKHRASIEACLKTNFGLLRFFRTGSFGNGTSIQGYSDVDYFASIPREKLKQNSSLTLVALQKALDARFPNTGVKIDKPAVVVPFGNDPSEITEIVPADFITKDSFDKYHYDMPNYSGGWMRSSPDAHKFYVNYYDDSQHFNGKLKKLIRFVKAWKYYREAPISSFYLEMFVAKYASTEKSIVYTIDLNVIFDRLLSSQLSPIPDPMNISGNISACAQENLQDALTKLTRARDRSKSARNSESSGNISDAFDWWNKVYNDNFPSYYY